jgi:hypothetical protein
MEASISKFESTKDWKQFWMCINVFYHNQEHFDRFEDQYFGNCGLMVWSWWISEVILDWKWRRELFTIIVGIGESLGIQPEDAPMPRLRKRFWCSENLGTLNAGPLSRGFQDLRTCKWDYSDATDTWGKIRNRNRLAWKNKTRIKSQDNSITIYQSTPIASSTNSYAFLQLFCLSFQYQNNPMRPPQTTSAILPPYSTYHWKKA